MFRVVPADVLKAARYRPCSRHCRGDMPVSR